MTVGVVLIACLSFFASVYIHYANSYASPLAILFSKDTLLTLLLIALIWSALEATLKLNEVYRSRPYSYILILQVIENVLGVSFLIFSTILFGLPYYGREVILLFCTLSSIFAFFSKAVFYHLLKAYRRRGHNVRKVLFVCDKAGERLLAQINRHYEWGYIVVGIVGDDYMMHKFENKLPVYPIANTDIEKILSQEIDDVIYARDDIDSQDITRLLDICTDLGITFRLSSSFLNRMSSSTYIRYFDTNAVLTISNTPTGYVSLLVKRFSDVIFSSLVIICGLPFFLIIALIIKIDSKGPIFFTQKRSGLRGKEFDVIKFRTMVVNAEDLKDSLSDQNEMSGPVFKMTDDPRITRIGRILRKTGIDEFPQFLNVFRGDMSVVGPRPPLPDEVAQYERWQMRRLAMKPGITCIWQVAPNRNSISFEDWMRMDMEYIDNWSLTLDFVLILKTVRAVFRADGK